MCFRHPSYDHVLVSRVAIRERRGNGDKGDLRAPVHDADAPREGAAVEILDQKRTRISTAAPGSSGCTMPSTAGPASAWGSGRPTRSTTQRCCTCSENSRVEILSRTNPSTGSDSTATLFPSVVSYIQMDDRSAFRNLTYLGSLCFGDSRSRRKLARSSNEFGSRRIGTPASGLRDADRCSQGSGARPSTR